MTLPHHPHALGRLMTRASWGMAIAGSLTMAGLAVMLVVTIVSRKLLGWQVTGDHELVRMFGAVAVSLMLPWCHIVGGNVVVDLFTARLPDWAGVLLDRAGSLLLAALMALLAWRTGAQAQQTLASGSFSPLLAWPVWIFQAGMIPGLIMTCAGGLYVGLAPNALSARDQLAAAAGAIE